MTLSQVQNSQTKCQHSVPPDNEKHLAQHKGKVLHENRQQRRIPHLLGGGGGGAPGTLPMKKTAFLGEKKDKKADEGNIQVDEE